MPYTFKQILEKVIKEKAPGPSSTFTMFHMLRAIELMAEKTTGRGKLAKNLSLGEGAVRTMTSRLKEAGLVETSRAGCSLTREGLKLWREYRSIFEKKIEIEKSELTLTDYNFAILIKNRGHKVKSGMEQRDTAVRAGARGATTIMFREGRLIIPSASNNVAEDFPSAANQIIELLEPEENDVIVIGSAGGLREAEYGALAAAWTLLNDC